MTRETVLIILGILIALSPYLGLPLWLLGIVLPLLGLLVVTYGVLARIAVKRSGTDRAAPVAPSAIVYEVPQA
jgi:hypothetical protein